MAYIKGTEILFSPIINMSGEGSNGKPIEVATEEEINALEVGTIFKYTGETTDTYEKGALYIVEAGE